MLTLFRLVIVLFIEFPFLESSGQDSSPVKIARERKFIKYQDFRFENGTMLGNGSDLGKQLINNSYYNGIDFRLGFRKADAYDVYSNVYRRPYFGIGFYSSTFYNPDIGTPNALYFFLTIPFEFEENKKFTFSYSAAFGLSYNFVPFDSTANPSNIFIGSNKNCYAHLGVVANYKINGKWALNGTLALKHFSNGAYRMPNLGINLIPLTIGVSYKFSDVEIDQTKKPIPPFKKYNMVNIMYAMGSKNFVKGDPNNLQTTLGLNYLWQKGYKYRMGMGMDIFYNANSNDRNTSGASNFSKSISYAVVGSWEWVLSKQLYVPLGIGIYLHRNVENKENKAYYERAGIRYRITDHFSTGITIKAHEFSADYFEWTVGYLSITTRISISRKVSYNIIVLNI